MSFWDLGSIGREQRMETERRLADASREALIAEIVALRTAAYPFVATFAGLDMAAPRGVSATSKLFPQAIREGADRNRLAVFDADAGRFGFVDVRGAPLHELDYAEQESVALLNPREGPPCLHDDACLLRVTWEGVGGGGIAGEVSAGDARRLAAAMGPA